MAGLQSNQDVTTSSSDAIAIFDWKQRLHYLQSQSEVGIWIECCRPECKKWRYIKDCHDPLDVPEIWYCCMSSDMSMASCDRRQELMPSSLIENHYNAGSVVWAHICSYPWWPGIVCHSWETFKYYKRRRNSQKPYQYHVTFFNTQKLEWDWVHIRKIKPFETTPYSNLITETIFNGIDYKDMLNEAYELALSALPLRLTERLEKFSFVAQYERFFNDDDNNNLVDGNTQKNMIISSDDEI